MYIIYMIGDEDGYDDDDDDGDDVMIILPKPLTREARHLICYRYA